MLARPPVGRDGDTVERVGGEKKGWPWKTVLATNPEPWLQPSGDVVDFAADLRWAGKERVYDLGCGIGRHTVYLARQGFEVYGSDIAGDGLAHTRQWLEAENLTAEVITSDFTVIPYPDSYFDAVLAVNVIYHGVKEDVETCLSEVHRVLRPGGYFFITFKSKRSVEWGKGRRIDANTFVQIGGLEDGIPHYFVDRKEVMRLMGRFKVIRLEHKSERSEEEHRRKRNAHWTVRSERA